MVSMLYICIGRNLLRWWMIDPDGYRHLQKVVVGVRLGTSERNKQAMLDKFGTEEKWIERTAQMIHSLGFSGTGSWSNEEAIASYNASHKEVLTRSIILNLMSGYGKKRGGTYQLPGNTGYPNQAGIVMLLQLTTMERGRRVKRP